MENQYDNTNRGAVWRNTDKREGKKDPDWSGSINIAGQDYWLSGWEGEQRSERSPAMTFSIKPKESRRQPQVADVDSLNKEIPF